MAYSTPDRSIHPPKPCPHCEGKGYIDIRDCSGDIQYSQTCSYCQGLGTIANSELTYSST